MDYRTALTSKTELRFGPETSFTIRNEIGRGGSAIVYDAYYITNAGDEKTVRIKECYPYDLQLRRDENRGLVCREDQADLFTKAKEQMYSDFRLCNTLFYAQTASDAIINTINIYEANNTVYVVSAWSRENALSNIHTGTLRDCISIVRQTAGVIQSIHEAGYLYLDTKPENISVINSSDKRVSLFDFDSLLPLSALKVLERNSHHRLSYTKGFAALELRREQINKLGPWTDVYGIGALLFSMLFGRTPEAPDCSSGAEYDFSRIPFSEPLPDRLFVQLTDFFHKTLVSFYPDRCQTMAPVLNELEKLETLSDPVYPYLIPTRFSPPVWMIGRDEEESILDEQCRDEDQLNLFICGIGGIGKSTLVRRYLSRHRSNWDSIVILSFSGSIRSTILNDSMLHINGTERLPEEKEMDYFERKMQKLREIILRDHVLLVIDNFEGEHDPELAEILALGCKKIFITRHDLGTLNLPMLKLGPLPDTNDQISLFLHYLESSSTDIQGNEIFPENKMLPLLPVSGSKAKTDSTVLEIISLLSGHTLALELFARQISNSFLSLSEALELLRKQGILHITTDRVDYQRDDQISYEQLETIITRLFETDRLSFLQTSILKALALFPAEGIAGREFMRLAALKNAEELHQLICFGWITRDRERISMHPLIRDVIRNIPQDKQNLTCVKQTLTSLYTDITSESHLEELYAKDLKDIDPYRMVTDHRKLLSSVITARTVLNGLQNDPLWGEPHVQKLLQAMVVNLPKSEDEAILHYGQMLLNFHEHLSSYEINQVIEAVEKVLLQHQEYDAALQVAESAKQYASDDLTMAEYYQRIGDFYDTRDHPGDRKKTQETLDLGIEYARRAPRAERKHILAEYILGKMNTIARRGFGDLDEFDALFDEMKQIIENDCLPYSEIHHGFAITMAFYWGEAEQNREEADKWIAEARIVAEKLFPQGLDYIDNMIVPPAIVYIDIQDFTACEAELREGIRICDEYKELSAYRRKKHDLQRYLLDVYLEGKLHVEAREILKILDRECREYGFPDTVQPEVRDYLADSQKTQNNE